MVTFKHAFIIYRCTTKKCMKNVTHHNAKSIGVLSMFLCSETVTSRGNGRQRHPKCVAYVQSAL